MTQTFEEWYETTKYANGGLQQDAAREAWHAAQASQREEVYSYVRDYVYHEAQDSEWDSGFNKAKAMCLEAIKCYLEGK